MIVLAMPSMATASDAQVGALVSHGITLLNKAKARPAINGLVVVQTELAATPASSSNGRTGKALALRGFGYAIKQLNAQLKAAAALAAGDLAGATAALDLPPEVGTWATLVRKAQTLLGLKVKLAARFK